MNKNTLTWAACLLFSLATGMPVAQAQSSYPPPPASFTQEQLDQMLAPVALYPDPLLAQLLMAATYPLEVVQAQRFAQARPGLQGDGLAHAVAPMPWDPSVKALVQFPSVLTMLNDRLDWMQQLGQAFLSQQASVMDTVQNLRTRAQIAGTLASGPQQRVLADDGVIVIEPANPQVVYVPYYNPVVAYGNWWWPSAQPVYWTPSAAYLAPRYSVGISASISFGNGTDVIRATFGDARPDWRQRQVIVTQTRITNVTNNNVVNNVTINRNVTVNQQPVVWHHDPRYAGARYQRTPSLAQAQAPQASPSMPPVRPAPPAAQAVPAPVASGHPPVAGATLPPPVRQDGQERQHQGQARPEPLQRAQQADGQQRQREQMVREQQHRYEQQARDQQRMQQQEHERQFQQHQQQMQEQQARQQHAKEQVRQQQQLEQQHPQEMRQVHQQQEQARHEQQARPQPREPQRHDDRRDDKG